METTYVKKLRKVLAIAKGSDGPVTTFAVNLLETIIDAKSELGEPISAESLQDAINSLPELRDRYLETRWGKPVGHNYTLSQLEVFTRRYTEAYLHKVSATVWPVLKMSESELSQYLKSKQSA